ncbi:MAG: hypothetical protein LJE61_10515 [Thiocapsa sp.]|nr:hypothetical protein [Thiocapsa sp.]MCG6896014.1 hypothetical protein [Thiocapsa sp.]MCG6985612.1 hypothetical protein [Thiocapsa sp.]
MSLYVVVRRGAAPALPALILAGVLLWVPGVAVLEAGESRIELRDGSVLSGELVGVGDGRYRIRSSVIGEVEVKEADVLSIRPTAATAASAAMLGSAPADPGGGIAGVQRRIVGDPEILSSVTALQGDPELHAALSDPELVRLVVSGDLEALRSDPRFLRLMEHPAIQAIVGHLIAR